MNSKAAATAIKKFNRSPPIHRVRNVYITIQNNTHEKRAAAAVAAEFKRMGTTCLKFHLFFTPHLMVDALSLANERGEGGNEPLESTAAEARF